jgi:hypothetical protein
MKATARSNDLLNWQMAGFQKAQRPADLRLTCVPTTETSSRACPSCPTDVRVTLRRRRRSPFGAGQAPRLGWSGRRGPDRMTRLGGPIQAEELTWRYTESVHWCIYTSDGSRKSPQDHRLLEQVRKTLYHLEHGLPASHDSGALTLLFASVLSCTFMQAADSNQ